MDWLEVPDGQQNRQFINTSNPNSNRYEKLQREFAAIDLSGDGKITYEELRKFLGKKSNRKFDEQLLQELFTRMDKNRDNAVSLEEFVSAIVEAENLIKQRIEQLKRQIASSKTELDKIKRRQFQAEADEVLNDNGIMNDSILTIKVIKAIGLENQPNKEYSSKVNVYVGNQKANTETASGNSPV